MTVKRWMLGKVNAADKRGDRSRAPAGTAAGVAAAGDAHEPSLSSFGGRLASLAQEAEHLGPYASLIAAIREELEQFATSQLRLHLAIAERDRYVLASIEVECEGSEEERDLMRRFIREFRPEQVKSYLAREVIAGLRNASAIDLSQFAGLNVETEHTGSSDDDNYGELLAELESGMPRSTARPYRVTLVGRWSEIDSTVRAVDAKSSRSTSPRTPLATRPVALDIEDGRGARKFELASVVPGRRYSIGKGEDCDIVVDGVYASRRHCEIWSDRGTWWVADAGSTNGIRVESAAGVIAREPSDARGAVRKTGIELRPGTWLVLAAHVQGEPLQYPRLSLRAPEAAQEAKPAPQPQILSSTPVTPIAAPRPRQGAWTITARMASGAKSVDLHENALPFRVGRSRNQALVIDWAHAEVSGRHFEIVAVDDSGASVVVHSDSGVAVDGEFHGAGAEFRWLPGQTLRLGRDGAAAACELTLSRGTPRT